MRAESLALTVSLLLAAPIAQAKAKTPIREGSVSVATGVRLHYLEAGHVGRAPALLLVPGWTMTASIWRGQLERFSSDRRVIAIDPRSQGASSKVSEGNTPEQRARDLDALLKKLNLSKVVLVGWSQGVQDVAAYVSQFGSARIAGYVLVDAAISSGPAAIERHPEAIKKLVQRLELYAASPRPYLKGMMGAIFARPVPPERVDRLVADSLQTPTSLGIAMLVSDLLTTDRRPALTRFDRPTLLVAADRSPELAEQKAEAARMPQAEIAVIPEAGHVVFVDQPEAFNQALASFLEKLKAT